MYSEVDSEIKDSLLHRQEADEDAQGLESTPAV